MDSQEGGARLASRLVMTADEAKVAVEDLTRLGGTILFQQFLTGRREAISLLYADHEVHASFHNGRSALRTTIRWNICITSKYCSAARYW